MRIRLSSLLLLLFVLLHPRAAHASIAYVSASHTVCEQTSASTTSSTCTLGASTTTGNDVVVGLAWKTITSTISKIASSGNCTFIPWANEVNGTNEYVAIYIAHSCAASTTVTVTMSAGTKWVVTIEEYSGVQNYGRVVTATGNTATPTVSVTTQDSNNYIVCASASLGNEGIPTSSTGNLRDANRTGTTSSDVAGAAIDNTVSSAGSVTCAVSITSSQWTIAAVELRSASPSGAVFRQGAINSTYGTPIIVSDNQGSSFSGDATHGWYNSDFPYSVNQGDLVIASAVFNSSQITAANLVSPWTGHGAEQFNTDSTAYTWDSANSGGIGNLWTGNAQNISPITSFSEGVSTDGALTAFDRMVAAEFSGISCAAVDAEAALTSTTPGTGTNNLSLPSITPGTSGDVIFAVVYVDNGTLALARAGTNVNWIMPGSMKNVPNSLAAEYYIQPTAGAITAEFTVTSGLTYIGYVVAFKTGTGCTQPTGIYLNSAQLINNTGGAVCQFTSGNPCTIHRLVGNLYAEITVGTSNTFTDSQSNSYAAVTGSGFNTNGCATSVQVGDNCLRYAANPTTGVTSVTEKDPGSGDISIVVFDFSGASSTSPFDTACNATGNQSSVANLEPCTVSTTHANEWMIGNLAVFNNCVVDSSPEQYLGDDNNGFAFAQDGSAGTYGFTFIGSACENGTGYANWLGIAGAFTAPTSAVHGFPIIF